MIDRVLFRNFRALRDVSLALGRLTVLVGPNASGKTSVLSGLLSLSEAGRLPLRDLFTAADRCRAATPDEVLLEASGRAEDGRTCRVQVGLQVADGTGEPPMGHIRLFAIPEESEGYVRESLQIAPQPLHGDAAVELPALSLFPQPAALLRFDASRLASPAHLEGPARVAPDGSNLAAVLTDLAVTWPDRFQALQAGLRAVIPAVERVRLIRAPVRRTEWETITVDREPLSRPVTRTYAGYELLFDMRGAEGIPARLASEGTLLVLGLLTAMHGPESPSLVLIDDLDRALHPRAQTDLLKQLRALLDARPDLQIVATSHSPYLLDDLAFDEIYLTTLGEDGAARCAPLTEHPDYPRWKDYMRPGEFWSMVAEDWIAKQDRGGDD
ncbi:MAG TPA: AAA family ATPase [Candidatus Nanopelagicales bacterium]|nr:AAA family ATPase [Candidatus Nanopelagicales bacterium]